MDVKASLVADVSPQAMYEVISDLGTYPQWLEIVTKAEKAEPVDSDPGPAWIITMRGQLGPLRRSKLLRMTRAVAEEPNLVRFERAEVDGRSHSDWTLQAAVVEAPADPDAGDGAVTLEMSLHYGGSMWIPMLDRLLADEINRSRSRLVELLAQGS